MLLQIINLLIITLKEVILQKTASFVFHTLLLILFQNKNYGTIIPKQVVCFGEVLWDILPSAALPGGAPMNVAYPLKKLGTNPALITKIGTDNYEEKLVNILFESEVSTAYFQVDYHNSTGLVYANVNNHHEVVYDIVYPFCMGFH